MLYDLDSHMARIEELTNGRGRSRMETIRVRYVPKLYGVKIIIFREKIYKLVKEIIMCLVVYVTRCLMLHQ